MADSVEHTSTSLSARFDEFIDNEYVTLIATAGPVLLLEGIFFIGPLFIMLMISTMTMENFNLIPEYGISNFINGVTKPKNLNAFKTTTAIATLATISTGIIAFPIAYFMAKSGGEYKNQLAAIVIVPFWTNYVVRIFGWRIILSRDGIVNTFFMRFGIINEPMTWILNSRFAIWLGLVYLWLPFMILPLYSTLENIDDVLLEAARDLGASRRAVFTRIVFPLSIPGLLAGTIFVFIFSMGAFVVPSLLGGGIPFVGTRIQYEFGFGADWPAGSALGSILMFIVVLTLGLLLRYADLEELF